MKRFFTLATSVSLLIVVLFTQNACKKTFDAPPGPSDPGIVANTTIATLKALHQVGGVFDQVTSDIIVSGIVTANDKSGNLYKEIYIEDSTGAIRVLLNATGLYNSFPVGRRVYLLAKGLYLSDDAGNIMIGSRSVVAGTPTLEGILSPIISNYLKGGTLNNPVVPKVVTLNQLGTAMQNPNIGRLIQLNSFEFVNPNKTYGDTSVYKSDQNDTIRNCTGEKVIVRSSAYANFSAQKVPQGNGPIVSLFVPYRTTKQLLLRDSSDVQFFGPTCDGAALFIERFETAPAASTFPYPAIVLPGWNNFAEVGTRVWEGHTFGGSNYAYFSAFGTGLNSVVGWLITKSINLNSTTNEKLSFNSKQDFLLSVYTGGGVNVASQLKVLISTDYTGSGSPLAATWTELGSSPSTGASFSPGSLTGAFPSSYTPSGDIDISSYSGNVYIAFKYIGADPAGTTTADHTSAWEVDDVKVTGQ